MVAVVVAVVQAVAAAFDEVEVLAVAVGPVKEVQGLDLPGRDWPLCHQTKYLGHGLW